MPKKIQRETVFDQILSKAKAEGMSFFSEFFNQHQAARFGDAGEVMSFLKAGIDKMHSGADDFKKAYEHLRKEYPDILTERCPSGSDKDAGK
jgi:hypothetical protein